MYCCTSVCTLSSIHVLVLQTSTVGCSEEGKFPCMETPADDPTCITELQICDGTADCPQGSDEPADCPTGTDISMVCSHL